MRIFVEVDVVSAFSSSTTGCEGERSGLNHWTEMTEGTCNVLRTFREVDVSPVSPNSTSQAERQKLKKHCVYVDTYKYENS